MISPYEAWSLGNHDRRCGALQEFRTLSIATAELKREFSDGERAAFRAAYCSWRRSRAQRGMPGQSLGVLAHHKLCSETRLNPQGVSPAKCQCSQKNNRVQCPVE